MVKASSRWSKTFQIKGAARSHAYTVLLVEPGGTETGAGVMSAGFLESFCSLTRAQAVPRSSPTMCRSSEAQAEIKDPTRDPVSE